VLGDKFEAVVIILSTGRTGTTALAEYFDAAYPQVKALHEPKPSRRLRIASHRFVCGECSEDDMVHLLVRSRRKLLAKISEPFYIESNPYLHGFLEVFQQVFRRVKVVHLTRDPRTYVRSAINFGSLGGMKRLMSGLLPYWILKPEWCEKALTRSWAQMNKVERAAWFWTIMNRRLNTGRQLYGDNYTQLRFEDVFDPQGLGLRSLAKWIGLPDEHRLIQGMAERKVNASSRQLLPKWDDWPQESKDAVIRECGALAREYGYDLAADRTPES